MAIDTRSKSKRNKGSPHLRALFVASNAHLMELTNPDGNEFVVLMSGPVNEDGKFAGTVVHTTNAWYVGHYYKTWDSEQFKPYVGKLRLSSVWGAE